MFVFRYHHHNHHLRRHRRPLHYHHIIIIIIIIIIISSPCSRNYKNDGILDRKEDPLIQVVRTHQTNTDSAVLQPARCLKAEVQRETKIKENIAEKTRKRWHRKTMHGQLPHNFDEKLVDIEQSYCWLKSGDIKGETESTIVAAQKTKQLVQTILRIKF